MYSVVLLLPFVIHVVECNSSLLIFIVLQYSVVNVYHNSFIHSSVLDIWVDYSLSLLQIVLP